MDQDKKEQQHRLYNREKSASAEKAWKRHHASYMRGARERERNYMNKTFYGVAKELEKTMDESRLSRDNIFDLEASISFETVSGALALKVNEENGTVSIACSLDETGSGAYGLQDTNNIKSVYEGLRDDLQNLCNNFDEELTQVLAKYGLKPTK